MSDIERSSAPLVPATDARAADADREAVAERLRIAAGDGRIDLAELDERLGRAYASRTYRELQVLVADLPARSAPALKQSGQWTVPRRIVAETTSGNIKIDFTEASCAHREVAVEAVGRTGWIRLVLPEGWAARVDPSSTNTSHIRNKAAETPDPGAPTVVVTGHPVFGYVTVRQRRRRR
jgi:hypothetical protein